MLSSRWAFEWSQQGEHVHVTVRVGQPGSRALAGRITLRADEAEELRALVDPFAGEEMHETTDGNR